MLKTIAGQSNEKGKTGFSFDENNMTYEWDNVHFTEEWMKSFERQSKIMAYHLSKNMPRKMKKKYRKLCK